jgi:chemotaxis protein CheC
VTTAPSVNLNELELDALTELVNLGVSRAAASLRSMVGEEIVLSVPSVAIVSRAEASKRVAERGPDRLVAVHQSFDGAISGRALLIFPETNSLELVRAVTGGNLPLEDIIELEQEALAETGNIVLNGCLSTIANLLRRSLKISLPEIVHGGGAELFDLVGAVSAEDVALFLYIDFSIRERDILGYIAILMDLPALTSLKALIADWIGRATDEASEAHVGS